MLNAGFIFSKKYVFQACHFHVRSGIRQQGALLRWIKDESMSVLSTQLQIRFGTSAQLSVALFACLHQTADLQFSRFQYLLIHCSL